MSVYPKEKMTRTVKWVFALPLTYVVYFALSLLLPDIGRARLVLSYILLILSFCLVSKFLLGFPLRSFLRQEGRFSLRLFWTGLLVMMLVSTGLSFVQMLLNPRLYEYSLRPQHMIGDWTLSIVIVLLAAFAEELLFRAFVAFFPSPTLERDSSKFWKYCLVSALLFVVAHFQNPEINGSQAVWAMLFYFVFGCFTMYFYMASGGIEFSFGVHVGNNLVPALFFSYPSAVLQTNTVFIDKNPVNAIVIIQALVCFSVCLFVLRSMMKKDLIE